MKKFLSLLIILPALMLQACGIEVVDTGNRGVKTKWGEVVGESLPEGLYFYNLFSESINEMNVQVKRWEVETSAFTKDVQTATL